MIRHDCDDTGAAQPPNNDHDKAEGGRVVTTYAIYGHGRKGSVRAAFPALAANAIVGQKVKTGQRIMLSGDTGVSFKNHLHIMVLEGPEAPGGGAPVVPVSRFNLPAPRATLPFVFKDIGVCKKLDWYTGTQEEVT